jgi:hypothetical protein
MLEKARREHLRLSSNFDIDNVFNFFVTAHHICDYFKENQAVDEALKALVKELCSEQDMLDCQDICNKAKHCCLTLGRYDPKKHPERPDPLTHRWSGAFGVVPFNTIPFNTNGKWEFWELRRHDNDNVHTKRRVDIKRLADRVLSRWDEFFNEHGL